MKKKLLISIICLIFLNGCIKSNLNSPEEIKIPEKFSKAKIETEQISPEIDFWLKFNIPELNSIIDKAFKNNKDIKVAVSNILSAGLIVKQAGSALYPQMDVSASAGKENKDSGSSDITTDSYSISARVSYEIDLFKRIRNKRDIAILSKKADIEDLKTIYINLASNICELYFNITSLNNKIRILEKNKGILQKEKELLAKRYKSGVSDYITLLEIKKLISETDSRISELKRSRHLSISAITTLTGEFINTDFKYEIDKFPDIDQIHPKGLPSEIIKSRPDVKSAFIALKIRNKEVATAIADRFPSFSLSADISRIGSDPDKGPAIYANTLSIAGNFLAPILDWGRRKAAVKEAEAKWTTSFYIYKKTLINAFSEIQDSVSNINKLQKSIEFKKASNSFLEKKFILKKQQYSLGKISFLELKEAERELLEPEAELTDLNKAYITSIISLAKASGGDWTYKYLNRRSEISNSGDIKNES